MSRVKFTLVWHERVDVEQPKSHAFYCSYVVKRSNGGPPPRRAVYVRSVEAVEAARSAGRLV